MTAGERTPDLVTQEIQREREELVRALSNLRTELRAATDVRAILRTKWPQLTAVATLAVGAIAAQQLLSRRRRGREKEPVVLARIGRLAIIERD